MLQEGEITKEADPETIFTSACDDFVADLFEVLTMSKHPLTTFQERFGTGHSPWTTLLQCLDLAGRHFSTIPLAVYLNSHKKQQLGVAKLRVSSREFIPSMALLGLFIPFMGDWNSLP